MADKEYIEREARAREIDKAFDDYGQGKIDILELYSECRASIICAPAADVVEVRHGAWKEYFMYGCWHYDCPFCDDGYATEEREKHPANYCSNCGAKLDGKGEGE